MGNLSYLSNSKVAVSDTSDSIGTNGLDVLKFDETVILMVWSSSVFKITLAVRGHLSYTMTNLLLK